MALQLVSMSEKWPRSYMLNFVDPRDAKIEVDNDKACETLAIGTQGFWQERPAWTLVLVLSKRSPGSCQKPTVMVLHHNGISDS